MCTRQRAASRIRNRTTDIRDIRRGLTSQNLFCSNGTDYFLTDMLATVPIVLICAYVKQTSMLLLLTGASTGARTRHSSAPSLTCIWSQMLVTIVEYVLGLVSSLTSTHCDGTVGKQNTLLIKFHGNAPIFACTVMNRSFEQEVSAEALTRPLALQQPLDVVVALFLIARQQTQHHVWWRLSRSQLTVDRSHQRLYLVARYRAPATNK